MRTLLLAEARSGSTSLANCIAEHLDKKYKIFIEPFNIGKYNLLNHKKNGYDFNKVDDLYNIENLFVKSIFMYGMPNYPKNSFNSNDEYFEWMFNFFDKIILLCRKNKILQAESFIINKKVNKIHSIGWHTPKIYKTNEIDKKVLNNKIKQYTTTQNVLLNISKELDYPVFYYEDIFVNCDKNKIINLFKYIGIVPNWSIIEKWVISNEFVVRIESIEEKKLI
jgi:hypothetical protein